MTTILFATTNPYKVREVRAILSPLGIEVLSLDSAAKDVEEPEEDADTFVGNACIKALHYARATGIECLAEDSGLEVDALGGAPGVFSARYAGTDGTREEKDHANNEKLLHELRDVAEEHRGARFVCALCLASSTGEILATATGTFEGRIALLPRGTGGFGYDPLLFLPDLGCTSAELPPEEKNRRSHRARALQELAGRLRELRRPG